MVETQRINIKRKLLLLLEFSQLLLTQSSPKFLQITCPSPNFFLPMTYSYHCLLLESSSSFDVLLSVVGLWFRTP